MARPTKYTKKLQEKADEYLKEYERLGDVVPSVIGLCLFLGVTRSTAYKWAGQKSKKQFSDTLERIKIEQYLRLINGGLSGKFNSNIVKLMLSHNHGMKETTTKELTGANGGPVKSDNKWTVEFVNATPLGGEEIPKLY